MSATESSARRHRGDACHRALAAGPADASLGESLGVLVTGVLPALVRGSVLAPRRGAMKLLTALDADRRAAIACWRGCGAEHDGQGVRLLGGRIVVLWGVDAIREVLDRSAETYASDAGAKAKGMSHFQPDALTLSRGEEWRDRRRFNEAVLASSRAGAPRRGALRGGRRRRGGPRCRRRGRSSGATGSGSSTASRCA